MKNRKFVVLTTALALLMSSMTVSAGAAIDTPTTSQEIEGDVNYVNTTIYEVTLPTTEGMSFTLDPQGLTSVSGGNAYDESAQGKLLGNGTMTAANDSSVDITLSSKFWVTDSANSLKLVDKDVSVNDAAQEIQLIIQSDVTGGDSDGTYRDALVVTSTSADAPSEYVEDMNKATYAFGVSGNDYVYTMTAGTGSEMNMKITGSVAKDYDWSAYTGAEAKTITLNAIFKFSAVADANQQTDDYVMELQDNGWVTYTFVNAPESNTITALTCNGTNRLAAYTNGNVIYADGVLSFNTTAVTNIFTQNSNSIVVTFGSADPITLTYTK